MQFVIRAHHPSLERPIQYFIPVESAIDDMIAAASKRHPQVRVFEVFKLTEQLIRTVNIPDPATTPKAGPASGPAPRPD